MKKIVLISGSPKSRHSVSGMLIDQIKGFAESKISVYQATKLTEEGDISESLKDILLADALLLVFPLYIDMLPAPMIRTLTLIEQAANEQEAGRGCGKGPVVYAICNCGFYEAEHTRFALDVARNFSSRCGLAWGYGLGIGCGGFLYSQKDLSKEPTVNIYAALRELCTAIQRDENHMTGDGKPNIFITPEVSRSFYKRAGNTDFLRAIARNGQKDTLNARPHTDDAVLR